MCRRLSDLGLIALVLLASALARAAPLRAAGEEEPVQITADQAEGGKSMTVLTGNVVIRQGTATLTGQTGFYDRDHHHQNIQGNVVYTDGTLRITSLTGDNYDDDHKVVLTGNVIVTDTSGTLQASQAVYYRREGRLMLDGDVTARDKGRTITAQRMIYVKDTKITTAEGNVIVNDRDDDAVLKAPLVRYNRETRFLRVPVASELQVSDEGKITFITSDSLDYDSNKHEAHAFSKVRITRDSLLAESGLATVYRDRHRAVLTVTPRASDSHGSTEGDTLEIYWNRKEVRRVVARVNAKAIYRTKPNPNRDEVSIGTGHEVILDLENQKARTLTVIGNARDEFHGTNLTTKEEEINTSEGDSIVVAFKDNHAQLARVHNGHTGRYQYTPGTKKGNAEDVHYTADRIDYDLDHNRVYLRQNARLEYKDLVLNADSVDYDMKRNILVARGHPRLKDANQAIDGEVMGYDLKHEQGSVLNGRTDYANGVYTGDEIKKVAQNVLNVEGGDYTTCDDPHPHYRIHSSEMKIYLHDKVVLKPVVFYLEDIPVLALPFYVFPIREGRHSGIIFPQFDFGFSSTGGRFIRNAGYYWAINDYADISAYGDYYQDSPRWIGYLQGRYNVRYLLNGQVYSSLSKDVRTGQTEWQLQGTHQQQIGDRSSLSVQADFISDASYLQDPGLGKSPEALVTRNLHSLLAFNHSWDGGNLNLALDRNQNLAVPSTDTVSQTLSEQLPTLQYSFSQRALGRANDATTGKGGVRPFLASTYFSLSGRLAREVTATNISRSDRSALGNTASLSDNRRLFGWLNFGPSFSVNHALVDQDALGNKYAQGVVWSGALGVSTSLYGTFQPHLGFFDGIRHVLSPSLSYVFQPEFKNLTYQQKDNDSTYVTASRFPGVAGIGLTAVKQSRMDLSLRNTFQLKIKSGGEIKRLDNFANLDFNTSYDFLATEHNTRPWSQVGTTLHVYPGPVGSFDASATYDPYKASGRSISQFNFSTNFSKTGRFTGGVTDTSGIPGTATLGAGRAPTPTTGGTGSWSVNVSYSMNGTAYLSGKTSVWSQSQRLNSRLSYQLSPNWHFDYSNQFDLSHGISIYQEISAQRDLHCWTASFTRRIQAGGVGFAGDSEYLFRISVKNRPEIYYQNGSSGLGSLFGSGSGLGSFLGQ